ncbi:MAG: cupredoxin family copper-binding protein [Patescibacteria group bacterium]
MNNKALGIGVVVVIIIGLFLLMPKGTEAPADNNGAAPVSGGTGSSDTTTGTSVDVSATVSTTVGAGQVAASIKGYAFAPGVIKVKKGTTVTWTNMDSVGHSVVADSGKWTSDLLAKGQTYSYTFDAVGTVAYHCGPHPYMKGTVEVTE